MYLTFKDFLEGCWNIPADTQNYLCKVSTNTYKEGILLSNGGWPAHCPRGMEVSVDDSVPDGKVKVICSAGESVFQWDKAQESVNG